MVEKEIRKDKIEYYLSISLEVSKRATCLRRLYGAILVKNDEIISTGYNGSARGSESCIDRGFCKREQLNIPSGERYELCRSVHGEANAIISAARRDSIGSTLYLAGIDAKTGEVLDTPEPCMMCKRMIINAGIEKVVMKRKDGYIIESPQEWIDKDLI